MAKVLICVECDRKIGDESWGKARNAQWVCDASYFKLRANGCNNSQQCCDLQCIVGITQPIWLCKPCVMRVRGPTKLEELCKWAGSNIVALRFGDHGTKEMLGVVGWKVWPVSNFAQQHPTTCNMVCERTKHISSNKVESCWPKRLRPFDCT